MICQPQARFPALEVKRALRDHHQKGAGKMSLHVLIYMGLAAAYFEAAFESVADCRWHCACREVVIALLYGSIAGLMMLEPTFIPLQSSLVA